MKKSILLSCFVLLILTACAAPQPSPTPAPTTAAVLKVSSSSFATGAAIPKTYTCSAENISPALEWAGAPSNTVSLALLVEDPDAPGGMWVHWVVYNLPPDSKGLAEDVARAQGLPAGAIEGKTSFNSTGYGGPCPPSGAHHYYFRLYALDVNLTTSGLDRAGLLKAMEGHILAQGDTMGVYQK
jgi:Raf kinase inhibitor-like YbhB/YbcL family protein